MAIDNIPIEVTENTQEVTLEIDDTSHPYYVGARAYVTQIPEGAIVTVIDKFGKTEATLLDGNYGNITDISYDPDTKTLKKVNGMVIDDVVALSDVAISNDYEDLDNLPDIDDIIDAHPVSNVQDGAISGAKLSDTLRSELIRKSDATQTKTVEVVADYNGLLESTADEVLVLDDDSYYGSGETVVFEASQDEFFTTLYQRNNGDYVRPKAKKTSVESIAPTYSIGNVVASYINHSEFSYGGGGAFSLDSVANEIDCSTFAFLTMQGITYENSRYNGLSSNILGSYVGDNIPRNQQSLTSSRLAYNASEMAQFFAEKNRLFLLDYDCAHPASQLQAGDILFESVPQDGGEEAERVKTRYYNIGHVVVVLAVYPEQDIIMIAAGGGMGAGSVNKMSSNVVKYGLVKIGENPNKHIVYARPRYGNEHIDYNDLIYNVPIGSTVSTPSAPGGVLSIVDRVKLKETLKANKMYTIAIKGSLPSYNKEHTVLGVYANSGWAFRTLGFDCADELVFPFVPKTDISDTLSIRVNLPSTETVAGTATYYIDELAIYDGLVPALQSFRSPKEWLESVQLPSGVDLNDITDTGIYHYEGANAINCPVTNTFTLLVFKGAEYGANAKGRLVRQVLFGNSVEMYLRVQQTSSWTVWLKATTTTA